MSDRKPHSWEKRILTDAHAEIDLGVRSYYNRPVEAIASDLESEARDFHDFIKDHRSRDHYHISIVREYNTICVFCKSNDDSFPPECCTAAQGTKKSTGKDRRMTPKLWTAPYRTNSGELCAAEVLSPARPRSWRIWLAGFRRWLVCELHQCPYYTHYKTKGPAVIGHLQYHRLQQARSCWTTVVEAFYEHDSDPPDDVLSKLADVEIAMRIF